jgi:hypothetical protein
MDALIDIFRIFNCNPMPLIQFVDYRNPASVMFQPDYD